MGTLVDNEKKIIDRIIADASSQAEASFQEVKVVVDDKIKSAEQQAQKIKDMAMEAAKIEAEKAKAKEISSADMQAKKKILCKKQELITLAIDKAKDKLFSYTVQEKEDLILTMLKNTHYDNTMEVILPDLDRGVLRAPLEKSGYKISEETRHILGGFVLKKEDTEYNYSFESIMNVQHEEIERIVAKILFDFN